jgi:transcription antitermination factor NusG
MERFIDSSTKMKNDITYFQLEEVELKKGDKVRIVGGLFDGYEGTLLKAKGRAKRMFLINFELLGAIGTHIEPQYIKVIK